MKKGLVNLLLFAGVGMVCLGGCQKMPEVSENGDILHAESSLERAVGDVAAREEGQEADAPVGQERFYDQVIGTKENGIWVCAGIPAVPEKISRLTLKAREDLNEDVLKAFLDSKNGKVQDLTQQYLAQQEAGLNAQQAEVDAGDGIERSKTVVMAHFGDDSAMVFSDGERKAAFYWKTAADYEDSGLMQKYRKLCGQVEAKELTRGWKNEGASFLVAQAKEMLIEKLKPVGISEIDFSKIDYYEHNGEACYQMNFTPRYEGIGMAQEFGGMGETEIIPQAMAWVTDEGVAEMHLWHVLGEIGEKRDAGKILSFSQVEDILEKYLEGNVLSGCSAAKLTQAEVVYYPVYKKSESELELIPAWHIYVPLDEWVGSEDPAYKQLASEAAAWNIYLDAATGELLRVD